MTSRDAREAGTRSFETIAFVVGSSARRAVLMRLANDPDTPRAILGDVGASESSVYDALNKLQERGLAVERDGTWAATGAGHLVADVVQLAGSVERLFDDGDYWRDHDVTGLPVEYRRRLGDFYPYEVLRSPQTDPYRSERVIAETIESADRVNIVAPIFNDRYSDALLESDASDRRLIMTPEMLLGLLDQDGADDDIDLPIRVVPADFALTVTDERVLLSLPGADGRYDQAAELVSDEESARQWAAELFDRYWSEATPLSEFVADVGGLE